MNILKKWFKQFSNFLFNANYWDQVPDTCRETFQKDLYKKSTGSDFDIDKEIKHSKFPDHTDNFKFEPVQKNNPYRSDIVDGIFLSPKVIQEQKCNLSNNQLDNEKYFDNKTITPLSDKEKEELNTLFAEEILPYATLDKTFEEPHVTSGYLHIDDPTFVNAATSYVDNSQKVEHQLDEQKSDEIKTKKNKRKYNKNKKK